MLATRAASREHELRRRFVALVHEMIRSDSARSRAAGEGTLPAISAWYELRDSSDGWQYAETFRGMIGVELRELLPEVGDGDRATLGRGEGFERLRALMTEWNAMKGGSG